MENKWRFLKEKSAPYLLLTPFVIWFLIFFGYAFIRVLFFSFTDYDLFATPRFVGLSNFQGLFREFLFARALKNSLTYAIIVTTFQTIGALILAVVLNYKIRGIKFFRAAYYMPSVTSSVVITLIFIWLFQRKGVINYLLTLFAQYRLLIGVFLIFFLLSQTLLVLKEKWRQRPVSIFEPSYVVLSLLLAVVITFLLKAGGFISILTVRPLETIWLNTRETTPNWAGSLAFPRPLAAIMFLNIWTTIPTFMLLYLAGLQDIPLSLYQAAEVDGASTVQKFWYVTAPQLRHITFLVVTMGLISTLQMFDQVAIIGGQAPQESIITLAYYVYVTMFPRSAIAEVGMASAAALVLAVLTLIIVVIQQRVTGERRYKSE